MPGAQDQVDSSDLNRRIQIQQNQYSFDAQNNRIDNWTTVYTCWANISNPAKGKGLYRKFLYGQLYPQLTTIIQIRFQQSVAIGAGDLNNKPMRVLYPAHGVNHIYQILGVENPNEANISLWLLCQENQAQAVN